MRQPHGSHGYPAWIRGTVPVVSLTAVRDELVGTLEETLRLARRREELIDELRRAASAGRRASRPGPPIRAVVLAALDDLGWPQNARFLEEYLWAKRELQLGSRAFASLRRDELRAWRRSPKARSAYIVPALNPDGSANPRWLQLRLG